MRECPWPVANTATAWYLERGGPWRVRFIYGAHYTVDLFAVSNPASQACPELPSPGAEVGLPACTQCSHAPAPAFSTPGLAACEGWGTARMGRVASTPAWIPEVVDQRAHAMPFVT